MTADPGGREDVFRRLPEGCLITDPRGVILESNLAAADLLGSDPVSLAGKPLSSFLRDGDEGPFQAFLDRLGDGSGPAEAQVELRLHRADGRSSPAALRAAASRDGSPSLRLLWVVRDLSRGEPGQGTIERERMDAVSRVCKGLIHSSSNALQVTLSGLEMLALEVEGNEEALGLIDHIKEAQEVLERMLERLRDYTSPLQIEVHENDLGEVLEEAWCQLGPARAGRQARLGGRTSGADLTCAVDRAATEKLLRSILGHSLRSCPDPVEIEALWSAGEVGGREAVVLRLRNRGLRVQPEEMEEYFEPFARSKSGGISLEPAIARRFARAQGGDVSLCKTPTGEIDLQVALPRALPGGDVDLKRRLATP